MNVRKVLSVVAVLVAGFAIASAPRTAHAQAKGASAKPNTDACKLQTSEKETPEQIAQRLIKDTAAARRLLAGCTRLIDSMAFQDVELALLHLRRSTVHIVLGNSSDAIKDIETSARHLKPAKDGKDFIRDILDLDKAIERIPAGQKDRKIAALTAQAKAVYNLGHFWNPVAIRINRDLLKLDPKNAEARAELIVRGGLTTLDPVSEACFNVVVSFLEPPTAKPLDAGIAACTKLINEVKLDNNDRAAAFRERGTYHYERGHLPEVVGDAKLENWRLAFGDFAEAIKLNPTNIYYLWRRAKMFAGTQSGGGYDDKASLEDHDRIVKLRPDNAWVYIDRHEALLNLGRIDEARADLVRADALAPKDDPKKRLDDLAEFAFVVQSSAALDCIAAKFDYEGVVMFRKRIIWTCSRAIALMNARKDTKGIESYYRNRGAMYVQDKATLDLALADFTEILKINPKDDRALFTRAVAYYNKDDHKGVLADCGELIRLKPQAPECYAMRGYAFYKLGQIPQAKADLQQAVKLDPNDKQSRIMLEGVEAGPQRAAPPASAGGCAQDNPDRAAGIAACAAIIKQGGSGEQLVNAYLVRGSLLLVQRDNTNALADFNQAVTRSPKSAAAYALRGQAHYGLGNDTEALADLSRSIELGFNAWRTYGLRAQLLSKRGDHAGAAKDYSKVIELEPKSAVAYAGRARAFIGMGRPEDAKSDANRSVELDPSEGGYTVWGSIHERWGNRNDAVNSYRRALAVNSSDAFAAERLRFLTPPPPPAGAQAPASGPQPSSPLERLKNVY